MNLKIAVSVLAEMQGQAALLKLRNSLDVQ